MSTLFEQYQALKRGKHQRTQGLNRGTQPIPLETLEGLFRDKLDDLNRQYLEGCWEHVSRTHPELLRKAHEAEDRLNQVWLDATAGKATLEDFERALETWYGGYLNCFEAYNQRAKSEQGAIQANDKRHI